MHFDLLDMEPEEELKTLEEAEAYEKYARDDPVGYVKNFLGIDLWLKQQMILREVNKPCKGIKKISVASGNGVGKTFLIGAIACNYSDRHNPGYVVISGASAKSISKTVWPTLRKVHNEALVDLGGTINKQTWERGTQWEVFWTSPDEPENFGGFRTANGVLIIIDEASCLPQLVHDAIVSIAAASGSVIVYFGNPIRLDGPFYDTFQSSGWINFQISSLEVVDLNIPGLATKAWVAERKEEWGETDPRYIARVLGLFPDSSDFVLIKPSWRKQILIKKELRRKGKLYMGVDIARYGKDRTSYCIRDDRCMRHQFSYNGHSLMKTVGIIQHLMEEYGICASEIFIDDTGLGGGVTDRLFELGIQINPLNFAALGAEPEKFTNVRAEMYWNMKDRMDPNSKTDPFYIPKQFNRTLKQATWTKWEPSSDNRIKLESKDKVTKIVGHSPDDADALALTFAPRAEDWCISTAS